MTDEIFTSIISILETQYIQKCPENILPVLQNLVTLDRFDMNVMFLSKKDKDSISKLFDQVSKLNQLSQTDLSNLKLKYSL